MKQCPFLLFLLFSVHFVFSQSEEKPWNFKLGLNAVDTFPTGDPSVNLGETGVLFESFFDVGAHWNFGGPNLEISRYLSTGLSMGIQGGFNSITKNLRAINEVYPYYNADIFIAFSPLDKKIVMPYLKFGYGLSSFGLNTRSENTFLSKEISKTFLFGFGVDLALSNDFGISIQTSFRNAHERYVPNHFQHQAGFYLDLGLKDSDKDGVPDKSDACPDTPGLKEFEGCPDTDGDKVIDKEDQCPEIAGSVEFNGCPDTDKDGIPDSLDHCPMLSGSLEMNGCPDSDGDGIADDLDECIDEAGPEENDGCPFPDKDSDGVPDKDDLCPDVAGTSENKGCPEESFKIMQAMNGFGELIFFPVDSSQIMGRRTLEVLNQIKSILYENPKIIIIIEGYASADGEERYNRNLSTRRAEAVLNYLVAQGISPFRLEVESYGEDNPIGDNSKPQGRAINRRVQFKLKGN